jgi:hypothetical protein
MLVRFVLFLKGLLYGPAPVPPTDEEVAKHDAWEDSHFAASYSPSPWEFYHDSVDLREKFLSHSLWILIRWRVACVKRPFSARDRFLFPRFVYNFVHPGKKLRVY